MSEQENMMSEKVSISGLLGWFLLLGLAIGAPIVIAAKDRIKRSERANMVYDAYVQYLEEDSKQAAATLDLSEFVPADYIVASADSAKYTAELQKFFTKNVDKIFRLDDFEFSPNKVVNPMVIERNIAHLASNNLNFAKRASHFEDAAFGYRRAVKTLNVQRRRNQERRK